MAKINLTEEDLRVLSECINNQTEIPEDLMTKLSPGFFDKLRQSGKFDYKELDKYKVPTIEYAGKRAESVILAQAAITGGAAPLQIVRSFANSLSACNAQAGNNGGWKNLIVQGDNLQFLKTCYMNQDPLIKDKVKGKVKLIYIDPPFGTGDVYGGKTGELSYSAKLMGAEYIETLRERLIYLRELLGPSGSLFIRIDYRFGYYVKVVLDEVFGKQNFKNHLVINKSSRPTEEINQYHSSHDFLFVYSKSTDSFFRNYEITRENPKWRAMHLPGIRWSPIPEKYVHLFSKANIKEKNGKCVSRARIILGEEMLPPGTRHWALSQESTFEFEQEGKIKLNSKGNPVEIYPVWDDEYLKNVRIDEEYLQGIITASGGKLKGDYYIVVPETCTIIADTTLKNSNKENVDFKLLKFPYKVLEDVSRQFQIEEQPSTQADINKLISSAGFYFNEDVKIVVEIVKGGFKIIKFETDILNKNKERFKGLEGLSMILIDKDYDGKVFDMDITVYAKEISEDGIIKAEGLGTRSHLIAIDKHGNESKIIKIG